MGICQEKGGATGQDGGETIHVSEFSFRFGFESSDNYVSGIIGDTLTKAKP